MILMYHLYIDNYSIINFAEMRMHNETGRNTSARKGSFMSKERSISSPRGIVTLRIVRVIPYSLSREPPWILGSVESECGCTPACIARRNAAARVTKDMRVCEFAKEQERKERTKRKKERESNITVASIQEPTVKVHDIVKVTNIDSKAFASHPREWNE